MAAGAEAVQEDSIISTPNVCGHCSILTPSITESTAILSSACENQLCHPPRMPVCRGRVNGHASS